MAWRFMAYEAAQHPNPLDNVHRISLHHEPLFTLDNTNSERVHVDTPGFRYHLDLSL